MWKKRIFGFWVITYLLILMVPLTVYSILAYSMSSSLEKQTDEYLHAKLFQMMQHVDASLTEVDNLFSNIARNSNILALESKTIQSVPSFYYKLSQTRNDLSSLQTYTKYIEYFYIFFQNGEFVMTPTTYMSPEDLFDKRHQQENYTVEAWLSLMKAQDFTGYVWLPAKESANQMVYIAALRDEFFSASKATLVVFLDIGRIEGELQETFHENFKIIADGRTLIDLSPEYPLDMEQDGLYQIVSPKTGWQYIYNPSPSGESRHSVIFISRCMLILCAILGAGAAIWLSVINYRPLKALLSGKGEESLRYREYIQIHNTIQRAEQRQAKLENDLANKQNEFRSLFLWRLLTASYTTSDQLQKDSIALGMDGESSYIVVLLMVRQMTIQPQTSQTLEYLIAEGVERVFGKNRLNMMTKINACFCCMLPIQLLPGSELKDKLTMLHHDLMERYALDCFITAGEIFEGLSQAAKAYQDALDMMRYCSLTESARVMTLEECKRPNTMPYFHSKLEAPLIHAIKIGDCTDAVEYLNQLFNECFNGVPASSLMFRLWLTNVIAVLTRAIEESDIPNKNELFMQLTKVIHSGSTANVESLQKELVDIVERTCELIYTANPGKSSSLYNQIVEFVKNHYHDSNLSVSGIAYEFSLNPTYLSNFFKDCTGVGLLTYINQVRVDKSVEYLIQGDSVGAAAQKCGFASDNTYIKVFKKHLGVTPGEYKKSLKK